MIAASYGFAPGVAEQIAHQAMETAKTTAMSPEEAMHALAKLTDKRPVRDLIRDLRTNTPGKLERLRNTPRRAWDTLARLARRVLIRR